MVIKKTALLPDIRNASDCQLSAFEQRRAEKNAPKSYQISVAADAIVRWRPDSQGGGIGHCRQLPTAPSGCHKLICSVRMGEHIVGKSSSVVTEILERQP
ncbi:hypothetical protein NA78x_003894 [Anatilimnocola sp. NA78]|uniref:hypothetical protein n=1 Tax=Anatilimnocola sp. NA78 TaxID=3415683 RepID=UPI003CE5069E